MKRLEIESRRRLLDGFFTVDEVVLRHERFDGTMSQPLTRLNLDRGDGAAVVLHDTSRRVVVLVRQFRYPTIDKGPGWLTELVAGVVGACARPEDVARAEAMEEAGYRVEALEAIGTFYLTPGGSSERIFLFYAPVSPAMRIADGGGLDHEGEDIEIIEWREADTWNALDEGRIHDAKTLVGLQWLRRRLEAST